MNVIKGTTVRMVKSYCEANKIDYKVYSRSGGIVFSLPAKKQIYLNVGMMVLKHHIQYDFLKTVEAYYLKKGRDFDKKYGPRVYLYELSGNDRYHRIITPCPLGEDCMVGSLSCASCSRYVSGDSAEQTVTCRGYVVKS